MQITQIGRGLSDFFRKLRRKEGQTIREYLSEFDRALARLTECGCTLPDMASAWVFVDRMSLEESAELNLLASVGNEYNLKRLQQAAIVQDRSLRKPWETSTRASSRDSAAGRGPRREWWNKRSSQSAHLTGHGEGEDHDFYEHDPDAELGAEDIVPEAVAEEWYESFMTHETAKQKYRDNLRQRGTSSEALRELANDRLAQAKARSFCAGCKRRGHWHKDSCCPLNQSGRKGAESNGTGGGGTTTQSPSTPAKTSYQCSVVYVTWDLGKPVEDTYLMAIADTACSKSVMGAGWLDSYLKETAKFDYKPQFVNVKENFKFGASRVFEASYAVIITFALRGVVIQAKVAVVHGDVPLLLSRGALAKLGAVLDVAENTADFKVINVKGFPLKITDTGHPAVPFVPIRPPAPYESHKDWASEDLKILSSECAYTGVCNLPQVVQAVHSVLVASTGSGEQPEVPETPQAPENLLDDNMHVKNRMCDRIFYPKKIGKAIVNMLTADVLCPEAFMTWWRQTNVSNDFWIETSELLVRVHVIPRRYFFSPTGWRDGGVMKSKLLNVIGRVRSTTGISCKSHRAIVPVHDVWGSLDEDQYPVLWVGRSLFARRLRPMRNFPASHDHVGPLIDRSASLATTDHREQVDMEVEQSGANGRSFACGNHHPPSLDGPRTQERHHGAQGADRSHQGGHDPQEAQLHETRRVEGSGDGTPHRPPREGDPRTGDAFDTRRDGGLEPQGDDVWTLSRMDLRGSTRGVPAVGDSRSGTVIERQRRPEDVRQLGQEQGHARAERRDVRCQPRPGVQCDDPLRAHGVGFGELEDGHPRTTRREVESGGARLPLRESDHSGFLLDSKGEGENTTSRANSDHPNDYEGKDQGGDGQHQLHGARGGRRGLGGDQEVGDTPGGAQGQTRHPPGKDVNEVFNYEGEEIPGFGGTGDQQLPLHDPGLPVPSGAQQSRTGQQLPVHDPGLPVPSGAQQSRTGQQLPAHDPGLPVPSGAQQSRTGQQLPVHDPGLPVPSGAQQSRTGQQFPVHDPGLPVPSGAQQSRTGQQLPVHDPGLPVPSGAQQSCTDDRQLPLHDPGLPVPSGAQQGCTGQQLPVHDPGLPDPQIHNQGHHTTFEACREGGPRPLFIEVYAGNGGLSRAMNLFGFETLQIDLPEWDLSRADRRRDLIRYVE